MKSLVKNIMDVTEGICSYIAFHKIRTAQKKDFFSIS